MKITGILFTTEMLRAILDEQKRQTRRIIKLNEFGASNLYGFYEFTFRDRHYIWNDLSEKLLIKKFCPYGVRGDRLVCKTTWFVDKKYDHLKPIELPEDVQIWSWFISDERPDWCGKLRNGRFIPKFLYAYFPCVTITNIRVEQIQDISEEDAIDEGISRVGELSTEPHWGWKDYTGNGQALSPIMSYQSLWDKINGEKYPWDSNPYVWVIDFEKINDAVI